MNAKPCVILTRPADASNRLELILKRAGWPVLACPTFSISTCDPVRQAFDGLLDVDLVFFVSGAAVRAFAEQLERLKIAMPTQVGLAAVGKTTADEITRMFGRDEVIKPAPGDTEDSESLWKVLLSRSSLPKRVLIVRGQDGRDWFADQLRQNGSSVTFHAAYCRSHATWPKATVFKLKSMADVRAPAIWVCSSGEGIIALARLARLHGLYPWIKSCQFVVSHDRHVHALAMALSLDEKQKNTQILVSNIEDNAILSSIESWVASSSFD